MNIDKKLKEFDEFIFEEARGCDCDSRDEKKCIFAKELNGKCNCYCHSVHNRNKDTRNFLRQALEQQQIEFDDYKQQYRWNAFDVNDAEEQAMKQQQADHKKELEVADERWRSNEKYRERYMDGYVEEKLSWEKDLIEKIEKIIEEERYSGAPIALNKLIKIIKEG